MSYLRGKRYEVEKKQGVRNDLTSRQFGEKLSTSEKLANEYNVGARTIERDADFAKGVDNLSDERNEILSGESEFTKTEVQNIGKAASKAERQAENNTWRNNDTLLSTIDKTETHNTQKQIAKDLNKSTGTVAKYDYVDTHGDDIIKDKLRKNEITPNQAYNDVKKEEKRKEREKRTIRKC